MKKFVVLAAMAGLAACSQAETAPEPVATDAVVEAPAEVAMTAADGGAPYGMYKITTADGKVMMEDVKEDGTYSSTLDGKVIETGTWEQKAPGTYCYTVDAEFVTEENSADQVCNNETVDADGVWSSTNPKGESVTVERVTA